MRVQSTCLGLILSLNLSISHLTGCEILIERAVCTTDNHCPPHQFCGVELGECFTLQALAEDLKSDPPLKPDMEVDMEVDMLIKDKFPPSTPLCDVHLPENEVLFRTAFTGALPQIVCDRGLLLVLAPTDQEGAGTFITRQSQCLPFFPESEAAGAEMLGGETAGAEMLGGETAGAEMLGGESAGSEIDSAPRLGIFQYARLAGDSEPRWYRRCPELTFGLNTRFQLLQTEDDRCGKGYLYYREGNDLYRRLNEVDLETCFEYDQLLGRSTREVNYVVTGTEISVVEGEKEFLLISPAENPEVRPPDNAIVEIATEARRKQYCSTSFNTSSPYSFYAWNPIRTGYGLAWFQTSGYFEGEAEVHFLSHFPEDNRQTCPSLAIDLFDITGFSEAQYHDMPLIFDHQHTTFYCRYTRGGACYLRAKDNRTLNSPPKTVQWKLSENFETTTLTSTKFDALHGHLLLVRQSTVESVPLNVLELWGEKENSVNTMTYQIDKVLNQDRNYLAAGLRFSDLHLYMRSETGDLAPLWFRSVAGGWSLEQPPTP